MKSVKKHVFLLLTMGIFLMLAACAKDDNSEATGSVKSESEDSKGGNDDEKDKNVTDNNEDAKQENNDELTEEGNVWELEEYAHIIKPGSEYITKCDIDNDGKDEEVVLYAAQPESKNEFPTTKIKIVKGDKTIYETAPILEGVKRYTDTSTTYYIVNKDDKNYLMEYRYTCWQGEVKWNCELISIDVQGNTEVVENLNANLSSGAWFEDVDLEENKEFYNAIKEYYTETEMILIVALSLDYSKMIFSTPEAVLTQEARFFEEPLGEVLNEEEFKSYDLEFKNSFEDDMNTYYEYWKKVS